MNRSFRLYVALTLAALPVAAQQRPRPAAPSTYTPTAAERQTVDQRAGELRALVQAGKSRSGSPGSRDAWADAEVFLQIATMADRLKLYTASSQVASVIRGLDVGIARARQLQKGQSPWTTQAGRTIRGYYSEIDDTAQPYSVVLPQTLGNSSGSRWRLDVVLHGRGTTEVSFLQQSLPPANPSPAVRPTELGFIELHPFGRANNGWRWAGETDVFEALRAVRRQYSIDPQRIVLRGFSMGGHGAWHIGAHYPTEWSAVSPGAGFSETRKYAKVVDPIPAYQEAAWHIYDAIDYAQNLFNTPFIAYGGELDPQLQASLNMKEAAEKEGLPFNLIVGPKTEHRYHPDSLKEIMRQLETHTRPQLPKSIRFTTWTTRYNRCAWITVDGMVSHYSRARVNAELGGDAAQIGTENVSALTVDPLPGNIRHLMVDGERIEVAGGQVHLRRQGKRWKTASAPPSGMVKRRGLQGPIDDAFTSRFLVVRPTAQPWSVEAAQYGISELARFRAEWRDGFRGELREKADSEVTDQDLAESNLILFGDPGSNRLLSRIAGRLPIAWSRDGVRVGDRKFDSGAVPVFIYPNPLNRNRYVVINTGHTFGAPEIAGSNVLLKPLLPDWAVVKPQANTRPQVLAADFFDEAWKLRAEKSLK